MLKGEKKKEDDKNAQPEINHRCFGTGTFIKGCGEAMLFCMNIIFKITCLVLFWLLNNEIKWVFKRGMGIEENNEGNTVYL